MGKAEKQGSPRRARRKAARSDGGVATPARKNARDTRATRVRNSTPNVRASKWLEGLKGVCLDLDGVLYVEGAVIAGAVEATQRLAAAGLAIRYVTNTTSRSRRSLAAKLAAMGFAARENEILSAPAAAASMLRAQGVRRLSVLATPDTLEDFADFETDAATPEAVVVGDLGDAWTPALLDRAMNHVLAGARLVALCKSRMWRRASGLVMDAGPYVAALEFATGASAEVAGKPSPEFFRAALRSMALRARDVVMIGDDPESDVAAAQAVGMRGVLVLTGKASPHDAKKIEHPDAIFPSLVEAADAIVEAAR
jgi:HAD superfamily hydrolase (TIGR01458 family)